MGKVKTMEAYNALDLGLFKLELLQGVKLDYASKSHCYQISLESSASISKAELEACFDLIAYTSKSDYEQSTTRWRPRAKKAEMKHNDMRYLIVRGVMEPSVLGFASFMLTYEVGHKVIYLYEIHLSDALRGQGIGKYLINTVSRIGTNAGVEKIMLTCFVRNSNAVEWYTHLGFVIDEYWPEARTLRSGIVKQADYRILSRALS